MKLQFAFGNPRSKKVKRKSVAKRHKKTKTKRVNHKKVAVVAKRRKKIFAKKRKSVKRKKNPESYIARKGGKIIGRSRQYATDRELRDAMSDVASVEKRMKDEASSLSPAARKALRVKWLKAKKALNARKEELKTAERYIEDGAVVTKFQTKPKEGKKVVAKKRKKKKSKKVKAKKVKKVSAKKVKRSKKRKGSKRKSKRASKRRHKKVAKHSKAPVKASRKTRRSKKRKGSKRRRARMITHKHASSMRHIKKGSSFRFKTTARKGKRKITVSGRVKVNPYRRNPMKALSAQSKKYLGIEASEMTALAVGGLSVPLLNSLAGKYLPGVVSKINQYVGPQAVGSVLPIVGAILLNAVAEHGVKSGKGHDALKMAGEGLAAAGIIGLAMSLSQKFVAPALGLSGINFTPGMRGINYTPNMGIMPQLNGINYTPDRSMGIMPQLNGMGSVDFGAANYGGGGGSKEARTQRSDFGADWSQDSEAEGLMEDENSYSASMN